MSRLLDVPAASYHADDLVDQPTLSKSVIQLLIDRSPAHAYTAHPKLNPNFSREDDAKYDVGTCAHQLFLEGVDALAIIPFDDWRTAAAKEARETARADHRIPLLAKQADEVYELVEAIRRQCDTFGVQPALFADGEPEQTLVWQENGVWCRARLDWLHNDFSAVDDLKSTRASASPDAWSRTALSIGVDIQAAFYGRGCRAVLGCEPEFRFVVVETSPPYAMSVFSLAPDTLALAEKKIDYAVELWARCLRNDSWPSYPQRVAHVTTPPWVEAAWLERELREAMA